MAYFSDQRVAELNKGHDDLYPKFHALRDRFMMRTYATRRGGEYAKHGFCRRLETLLRQIHNVWEILPPGRQEIPTMEQTLDAATAIQAFVMNAFGCLDNIAWVWVFEKNVKRPDGAGLQQRQVGLNKQIIRDALTQEFRDYLDGREEWLENLVSFRDSLAHRIPLYIPRYAVPTANAERYRQIDEAKWREPAKSSPAEYEKLKAEQLGLCQFVPGMMHSIFEHSPQVEFHTQLITDYNTIDEHGSVLLTELAREHVGEAEVIAE